MPPKPVGSILIDGCMPSAGYVWIDYAPYPITNPFLSDGH